MSENHYYLGLSVTYHDPSIAILDADGNVLFAEAAERWLQLKRGLNNEPDALFRIAELLQQYCGSAGRITVALNWRRERPLYETVCRLADYFSPSGLMRPRFASRATFLEKYKVFHMLGCQVWSMKRGGFNTARMVREQFPQLVPEFRNYDHHLTHAAAGCYSSPFSEAMCMVVDSYGERGSLAFYRYRDGKLVPYWSLRGIESLGFYYMKLTELCGFDWLKGEEWKVMGLASYGRLDEPLLDGLRSTIRVEGLGLKQDLERLRTVLQALEMRYRGLEPMQCADLAHTGQHFFCGLLLELLERLGARTGYGNLVVSGGCALNSAFNGKILQQTGYSDVYIPPAPGDDGTALGAASLACAEASGGRLNPERVRLSAYLGSTPSVQTLARLVKHGSGLKCSRPGAGLYAETAQLLADGKLVGWMRGRAEFGPRALGNRSILADPRRAGMKDEINRRVKFREAFRPFAPAILHEYGDEYFEDYVATPYMERALRFRSQVCDRVPAVVHVDQTGRLQSVKREWNEPFYELLCAFHRISGVPVLLNTSFNIMGKPIVHSVEDAVGVFMTSGLDALVIEDYLFTGG